MYGLILLLGYPVHKIVTEEGLNSWFNAKVLAGKDFDSILEDHGFHSPLRH